MTTKELRKTLAQLKRDLQVGTKMKCTQHAIKPERVGVVNTIDKVQTNSVRRDDGFWLEIPRATLVEYVGNTIKFYEAGTREMDAMEKYHFGIMEKLEYWDRQSYIHKNGTGHIYGNYGEIKKGVKRYLNTDKMQDEKIKGELIYTFELI